MEADTISKPSLVSRILRWLRAEDVADKEREEDERMYARAETRIIVGLGNPGKQYANTRHNAGWMALDVLAKRANAPAPKNRLHAEITETRYKDFRLVIAKPQTFMNASGISVRELINWYKVKPQDVLIAVDDLDIPLGRIRVRSNGSAGGHNGLKSIFQETGTQDFPRVRIGIGRPRHANAQAIGHVLGAFSTDEQPHIAAVMDAAADAIDLWLDQGILATMNSVNGIASVIPIIDE